MTVAYDYKYAVRETNTKAFLPVGETIDNWLTNQIISEAHLYATHADAEEFIEWHKYWEKHPDEGPRIKAPMADNLEIVEIRVMYEPLED